MKEKIKELMVKHREIIVYLIVGLMTTAFSWGIAFLGKVFIFPDLKEVPFHNDLNNTIAWAAGVIFAYPLNRKWVFQSKNPKIFVEFLKFAASRTSTWLMDIVIMRVTVNVIGIDYMIAKMFISSVIVTIANYVFSKVLIFKKKAEPEEKKEENK